MLILFFRIEPVTGVIATLDVKVLVGRLAAVDVGEVVFGLHHVRWVEGAIDGCDLLVALVIVELWVLVELVGELGEHDDKWERGGSVESVRW